MKRRTTLSIALAVGLVLVSLMSTGSAVLAGPPQRCKADTGLIGPLGPEQVLRVSVAAGDVNNDGTIFVRIHRMTYEMCNASPKLCVASQSLSAPVGLRAGEGAFFDIPYDIEEPPAVRAVVHSTNPNVKVMGIVFDTSTQRVVSIFQALCTNEVLSDF